MPREYITRLVFDRNAEAMAVVQKGLKVVGGIAYRPFPHRTFAEIVFFAISGVYQINVSRGPQSIQTSLTWASAGIRWSFDESF